MCRGPSRRIVSDVATLTAATDRVAAVLRLELQNLGSAGILSKESCTTVRGRIPGPQVKELLYPYLGLVHTLYLDSLRVPWT